MDDCDPVHSDAVERRLVALRVDILGQDAADARRQGLVPRRKSRHMGDDRAFCGGDFYHLSVVGRRLFRLVGAGLY
jgi:hypothetical protein